MGYEYGILNIRYGGVIEFSHTPVVYVGGETGELTLDSDRASYAEVRDYLKEKGYVDSDFKTFYKAEDKSLQHLYSDWSSLELGGLIHKNGEVDIYVQHDNGVNENFVQLGSRPSEVRHAVETSNDTESEDESYGNDLKNDNDPQSEHDNSDSDEDYSAVYDGDSEVDEDIELNEYRKQLTMDSEKKKRGVAGLGDAVKELTRLERRVQVLKNRADYDPEAEVDSEDSYETDEEGNQKWKDSKYEKFDERDRIPIFKPGMLFVDGHKQFKRAIDNYAVFSHRQIKYKTNNSKKIDARCVEGYDWRIYGSYNNLQAFHVKTYIDKHTCTVSLTNSRVTSSWLAQYYEKHFKVMPRLRPSQLQRLLHEELGVSTSIDTCISAKKRAMEVLYGEITLQYKRLWDYVEELKLKNPGSKKTHVAPKRKGLGLAPPALPPGHFHWKCRGLTYNPIGRSSISAAHIKKMRSPRKRGGASGSGGSGSKDQS